MPSVNVLLPPVFRFARRDVDLERLDGRDLEFEAAIGAGEDLPLDEVRLSDGAAALRAIRHAVAPWRRRSTSATHSALLESAYCSRPSASCARASWMRTASGEGPPCVVRRASDVRTSRTSVTSSPNRGSNCRNDAPSTVPSDFAR